MARVTRDMQSALSGQVLDRMVEVLNDGLDVSREEIVHRALCAGFDMALTFVEGMGITTGRYYIESVGEGFAASKHSRKRGN